MTTTLLSASGKWARISRRVKSDTASTEREARMLAATSVRRRKPSRTVKSRGSAKNDRSWTVVTRGTRNHSGQT